MGADTHAGPVGCRLGVGPRVTVLDQRAQEFIDHVRVTAAVAAALDKREVVCILDRLREFLNRLGQQVGVIGDVYLLWDFCLGTLGHVQDTRLAFDKRPLEALLAAVDSILSRYWRATSYRKRQTCAERSLS